MPDANPGPIGIGIARSNAALVADISSARQEIRDLSNPTVALDTSPFDPMEHINFESPWVGLHPESTRRNTARPRGWRARPTSTT